MSSQTLVRIAAVLLCIGTTSASNTSPSPTTGSDSLHWTSEAKLNRFPKSTRGQLTISGSSIEFRPAKGELEGWGFEDIRTVHLRNSRKLSLVTYENRRWPISGDRQLDFDLTSPMPPEVAAELVHRVKKPAINGVPISRESALTTVGARHRTRTGGSDGVLRFRDGGIDYLTAKGDDSRSWRWADIQTLARPQPYRLRIGGYLETFDFELKQLLPDDLFDHLWDRLYAAGLNTREEGGHVHADSH